MDVQAHITGGKDTCPCGSGKDYSLCCEKKGIRYGLFEFGSRKVVFDVGKTDRAIEALLGFFADDVAALLNDGTHLDVDSALGKLRHTYHLFEESLAPFAKASSCGNGCNFCCHHIIETTPVEAEAVRRFVESQFDDSAKAHVLSRIQQYKSHYPLHLALHEEYDVDLQDRYFERRVPCPFLSLEGSCMVYACRPLVCRTYMVFSDPEQCRIGDEMAVYEAEYFPEVHRAAQFLSMLTFENIKIRRHLPDWFINEFKF